MYSNIILLKLIFENWHGKVANKLIESGVVEGLAMIWLFINNLFYFVYITVTWFLINYCDITNLSILINDLQHLYYYNFYNCFELNVVLLEKIIFFSMVLNYFIKYLLIVFCNKLFLALIFKLFFLSLFTAILLFINFFYIIIFYKKFFPLLLNFIKITVKINFSIYYFLGASLFFFFKLPFMVLFFICKVLKFCFFYLLSFSLVNITLTFMTISVYKLVLMILFSSYFYLGEVFFFLIKPIMTYAITFFLNFTWIIFSFLKLNFIKITLNFDTLFSEIFWPIIRNNLPTWFKIPSIDIYNGWEKIFSYEFRRFWTIKIYNNCAYFYDQYFLAFLIYLKTKVINTLNFFVDFPIKIRNAVIYFHHSHKWKLYRGENKIILIKFYWSWKKSYGLVRFISFIVYSLVQFPVLIFNGLVDLALNYFVLVVKANYVVYMTLKNHLFTVSLIAEYVIEPIFFFITYALGVCYYAISDLVENYIVYFNTHNYYGFRPNMARLSYPHKISFFTHNPIAYTSSSVIYSMVVFFKAVILSIKVFVFNYFELFIQILRAIDIVLFDIKLEMNLLITPIFTEFNSIELKIYFSILWFFKNIYYNFCAMPLAFLYFSLTVLISAIQFLVYIVSNGFFKLIFVAFFNPINEFFSYFYVSIINYKLPSLVYFLGNYLVKLWVYSHAELADIIVKFEVLNRHLIEQNFIQSTLVINLFKDYSKFNNFGIYEHQDLISILSIKNLLGIFFFLYLGFIIRMLKSSWFSYNYFHTSMLLVEFEKILDSNDDNFNEMYFKIYHEELAKDIGVRTLSTFTQPQFIVDKFYDEWFSGGHHQFRQLKWRFLRRNQRKNIKIKNLFFQNTDYFDFFEREKYFYNGVDFFKHVRYTFFRIIYSYYRFYGFYNFKMFSKYASFISCNGFNKKIVGYMSCKAKHEYFYYFLPFFVLNPYPKHSYAYKIGNKKITLVGRSREIRDITNSLFNWLSISNFFWLIFYIVVFIPLLALKFIRLCVINIFKKP